MMSSMIERVAREIAGHVGPDYDDLPTDQAQFREWQRTGEVPTQVSQLDLLEAARAAIAAMREPDEGMIKAGQKAAVIALSRDGGYRMEDTWQAMIDQALKGEQ